MVPLRTHADIARALQNLGTTLDAAPALDVGKAKDPQLAHELVNVLDGIAPAELERLRATISEASPTSAAARPEQAPTKAQVEGKLPAKKGKEPRIDANPPAVAVFLQTYDVDKKAPRPLERVLVHCAHIHSVLAQQTDPKKLVDVVMAKDLRRYVFLLEGIAKLYSERYQDARDVYDEAKKLEDSIGLLSATRTNLAYGKDVLGKASTPSQHDDAQKAVAHLEDLEKKAKKALQKLLQERWMPREKDGQIPALRDLVRGWGKAKWDNYTDDKKLVRKLLRERLVQLSDRTYDMKNLQEGIHELRRQLRWFPIYAEALNGLVQLDPKKNPVPEYQPLLDVALATSKYVDSPSDAREVDAIFISKSLYVALMQLTLDLGSIKDAGEPYEDLQHAFVATKCAKNLDGARLKVVELIGGDRLERDVHKSAAALYATMKERKLVEKLAKAIKEG